MSRNSAWIRAAVLGLVVGINLSWDCSPTSPTTLLNLTGAWSGTLGQPGSGTAFRVIWSATQSGTSVSGPMAVTKAVDNLSLAGTLSGTLSGNNLFVTYTVPRGNVPGFASCQISGTGSAVAANDSSIAGNLNVTTSSCEGFAGHPTGSQAISLTKP